MAWRGKNGSLVYRCSPGVAGYWLLYGYDSNKKIFNVAGYVSINGLNRYENFELSFSDFLLSLPQSDEETNYQTNIMFNHLCSIKKAYSPEKINIEKRIPK